MRTLSKTLLFLSQLVAGIGWLGIAAWLFAAKGAGLGLLALLVPPADLVLGLITPLWPLVVAFLVLAVAAYFTESAAEPRQA